MKGLIYRGSIWKTMKRASLFCPKLGFYVMSLAITTIQMPFPSLLTLCGILGFFLITSAFVDLVKDIHLNLLLHTQTNLT